MDAFRGLSADRRKDQEELSEHEAMMLFFYDSQGVSRTQDEGEDATQFGAKHLEVMPQHFQRFLLLAQLAHKVCR